MMTLTVGTRFFPSQYCNMPELTFNIERAMSSYVDSLEESTLPYKTRKPPTIDPDAKKYSGIVWEQPVKIRDVSRELLNYFGHYNDAFRPVSYTHLTLPTSDLV